MKLNRYYRYIDRQEEEHGTLFLEVKFQLIYVEGMMEIEKPLFVCQ